MKLKDGFEILNIGGDTVAIWTGGNTVDLRNTIALNSVAEPLFRQLQKGADEKALAAMLTDTYDVSEEKAKKDVAVFVQGLKEKDLLE